MKDLDADEGPTATPPEPPTAREQLAALGARSVVWGLVPHKREGKGRKDEKVPLRTSGRKASSTEPEQWAHLAQAEQAATQLAERSPEQWPPDLTGIVIQGVGIMLGELSGTEGRWLVGVDLDLCRSPRTGKVEPWAQRIVDQLDSYTEVSPSGTGLKILGFVDRLPPALRDGAGRGAGMERNPSTAVIPEGAEDSDHLAPEIGIYTGHPGGGRYFTLTWNHLDAHDEVNDITDALAELAHEVAGWGGGKVAGPRRRMNDTAGHAQHGGDLVDPITGEVVTAKLCRDPGGAIPDQIQALIDDDDIFAKLWRHGVKPDKGGDPSASGLDCSLAVYLAGHTPFPLGVIVGALWRFVHGQIGGGKLKGHAAERQVHRLLGKAVGLRQERAQAGQDGRDYSQDGLALALGDLWRDDARYVAVWARWLFWDGTRWKIDDNLAHMTKVRKFVFGKVRELVAKIPADATDTERGKVRTAAKGMRSAASIAGVASLARSNEELVAAPGQWDLDPRLLGTPAGVVDLRTGELGPAQRGAFITKVTAVPPAPPGTPPPKPWLDFLERIFCHDPDELIPYIQRLAGYAATGLTVEQKLFLAYGEGQNGKRVLFNTLFGTLGEYSKAASGDLLLATTAIRHPTELAALRGARLALMSEVPENATWNEPLLKRLTGEDPITARFMHQDEFTFMPSFTPILQVNDLPRFSKADVALRRRMELIPFEQTIPDNEKDEHLAEKLKAEWPGILRWVLDGAVAYLRDGLRPPKSVRQATEVYLTRFDLLTGWLENCCETGPDAKLTRVSDLYAHFVTWCVGRGGRPMSRMAFSMQLEKGKGFEKVEKNAANGFHIEPVGSDRD